MKPEFKIKKEKSGVCSMSVKGDLTIPYAQDLKGNLSKCLEQGGNFEINLNEVTSLDVTAVQLFESVRTNFKAMDKVLTIAPPVKKDVLELLTKTGLIHIIQGK